MNVRSLVCLVGFFINQASSSCESLDGSLVSTDYGCIRGLVKDIGRSFTSIPYAKPPIRENDLRFRDPVDPDEWNDILNATTIAPACMQKDCKDLDITCYRPAGAIMSEDCLYLNVYTPSLSDCDESLPVLFWIHGGTYYRSWSGSPMYNAQRMAYLNKVIVVTINYRLGSFGLYVMHSSFSISHNHKTCLYSFYDRDNGFEGNYGFLDQLQALKFTYENIVYFGGDKDRIVLFGESAGASSVATILMKRFNSMYSGAIMLSPPLGLPYRTSRTWQNLPTKYVAYANCNGSESIEYCMRNEVTSEQLLSAQLESQSDLIAYCKYFDCYWLFSFMPWTPTFKTRELQQTQPLSAFMDGEYKKVPIIIGSDKNEGVWFVYDLISAIYGSYDRGLCAAQYQAMLHAVLGYEFATKIVEHFADQEPDCEGGDYRPLLSKIVSEILFVCPIRNSSISISQYSDVYKFHYEYLYQFDPSGQFFGDNEYCQGKNGNICHGVELPILFQSDALSFSKKEIKLSKIIQKYFSNLAKDGAPGYKKKEWNMFTEFDESSMVFGRDGKRMEIESEYEENNGHDCAFWEETGYPQLWWVDSPFDRIEFLKIFKNETFREELASDKECNAECFVEAAAQYSEMEIMKETNDIEIKNAVDMLILFVYFIVGVCFFGIGICIGNGLWKSRDSNLFVDV